MDLKTFKRAIWEYGGATKLAADLSVSRQLIYKWMGDRRIPEHRLAAVKQALGEHALADQK